MSMGTVTFCIDGDSDYVQFAIERIQQVIEEQCPDISYSVSEDTDDD